MPDRTASSGIRRPDTNTPLSVPDSNSSNQEDVKVDHERNSKWWRYQLLQELKYTFYRRDGIDMMRSEEKAKKVIGEIEDAIGAADDAARGKMFFVLNANMRASKLEEAKLLKMDEDQTKAYGVIQQVLF